MIKILVFLVGLTLGYAAKSSVKTKDPCQDYPSCKLISDQMFANYCSRSTLKNMCPTHCDPKCNNSTTEISVKVLSVESLEEDDYSEEEESHSPSLTTSSTTTTKKVKHSRKKNSRKKSKQVSPVTTTTSTTLSTPIQTTTTEEIIEEESDETEETSAVPELKFSESKTVNTEETSTVTTTTTIKVLQTEIDESAVTKTMANLPNETIYVPLYEAGFVQRVIPTSNKPECDFSQAVVCKKEKCNHNAVWCPVTNDVPKEQLEILLNYTTDIYMFETQGRIENNETVTNFLMQYLNDAGVLVSQLYRTDTKNSSVINKFVFEPAIRTNYIRLTPIDYVESIALRFEVYSKGVLYKPDK